jgi:rubrerythrin
VSVSPLDDLGVFLVHAVVLEDEAATRYDELADTMEVHHNDEVAALFRQMASYSKLHLAEATQHAAEHAGGLPDLKPWEFDWPGAESPESGQTESTHYLMTPHHALKLALAAEQSAYSFYAGVAANARSEHIRELAAEFAAEEAEHAEALEQWLQRYPAPPRAWDEDLDPPAAVD